MYCEYYGLKEKPFSITPNPRFFFLSRNHRDAFAHLLYGIRNRVGFIELTGEVGTGKTTVLRTLLGELDEKECRVGLILNPRLSAPELLRSICREYGLTGDGSVLEMTEELNRFLLQENSGGRTVVLIIDEAQNLEPAVLEQIRLLSNLETDTEKLIQIILAGQPELQALLARPELRQLGQRIAVRYHLGALDREETAAYIIHRLEVAGARGLRFTPAALKALYAYSCGIPRLLNIVCDRAVLTAFTEDSWTVSGRLARGAVRELRREGGEGRGKMRPWRFALLFLVLLVVSAIYLAIPRGTNLFATALSPSSAVPENKGTPVKPELKKDQAKK